MLIENINRTIIYIKLSGGITLSKNVVLFVLVFLLTVQPCVTLMRANKHAKSFPIAGE